jgi:class 3 adenylate cyclase
LAEVAKRRAGGKAPSGLVAFLLTDIEGSTRLWQSQPALMRQVIHRHDSLVTEAIRARGGRVLNDHGEGDSVFAVFAQASEALAAARDIQRRLHEEMWPQETPIRVRIAINTGEAVGDYRGMAANRCGRIRSLAQGGQVLISQATMALTRDELPEGIRLVDLGLQRLRDVASPEHIFEARIDGLRGPNVGGHGRLRSRVAKLAVDRWSRALVAAPAVAVVLAAVLIVELVTHTPGHSSPSGRPISSPRAVSLANLRIVTVAGNGIAGFAPGTLRATDAELNHPEGIAVDSQGNVYIADTLNNLVRVMRPDGTLQEWVGGGQRFAAEGEGASEVLLNRPTRVQVDNEGNLCVVDTGGNRILTVNSLDRVFLVAGSGLRGAPIAGDGSLSARFDAPIAADCVSHGSCTRGLTMNSAISAAIIDSGTHHVWLVGNGTIGDYLVGGNAGLMTTLPPLAAGGNPDLIQTVPGACPSSGESGWLYISDSGAHKVLRIYPDTGSQITIAGNGKPGYSGDGGSASDAQLNFPAGLALDSSLRLYVADAGNDVIRVVDHGMITTIAGNGLPGFLGDGGPASQAQLSAPSAVAIAPDGNIYVADTGNNRIRKLSPFN